MKKTLLAIMTTVCVMGALFGGIIKNNNDLHEAEIDMLTSTYEAALERKDADMDELEHQIMQIVKGHGYEVRFTSDDGSVHTWSSEGNGTAKDLTKLNIDSRD